MNKKMNLNDLKVQSFITNVDESKGQTVKGGLIPNSHGCIPFSISPCSQKSEWATGCMPIREEHISTFKPAKP